VPPKNNIITTSSYENSRLHSSIRGNLHTPQSCRVLLHVSTLVHTHLHLLPSVFFQSHVHRMKSWKVSIGAPRHFLLVILPFVTPASRLASLNFLSIMSSQQDIQQPKAGDPSSRRFSEPDKLVLPMQGAASRSPTSKEIRTRLDELSGKEGWISPFQHKLIGTNLLQLGY
jgi:hypothetical protein